MKVSLLVPAYNEEENIRVLVDEFQRFVGEKHLDWELVIVDDGSTDNTLQIAIDASKRYPNIKVASHRRNFGKTEAIKTGLENSTGDILVIFDADMQYTFEDALELAKMVEEGKCDLAAGWKHGKYEKRTVSAIYNLLGRLLFKIPVHDMNAMKAMKREVLKSIPLRKDWHRYIVALAHDRGFKIGEKKVTLLPRRYGVPKYSSPWRIIIGFVDLVTVKFQIAFMRKPMLFFGSLGGLSLLLGFIVGIIALYLRYVLGHGYRPLLYLVMLLIVSGLILITLGFIGELVAGLYDLVEDLEKRIQKESHQKGQ